MKKTIVTIMLCLLAGSAFADTATYQFRSVPCTDIGINPELGRWEQKFNWYIQLYSNAEIPQNQILQVIKEENGEAYLSYSSKIFGPYTSNTLILPKKEDRPKEYVKYSINNGKSYLVDLYLKHDKDKLNLVVTTWYKSTAWFIGSAFSGNLENKCFIADIPKEYLDLEAKAKADAEQKALDDEKNKKKWATGE